MTETLYTVGLALDTSALQKGAQQARASLLQVAQAESQLERQHTQTARALSTQARETATAAARLRDQARAAREARDVKLADSLNAQARALSTQAREARASATALREQALRAREAAQAARQHAQPAAPGAVGATLQGVGGGGLLGGARAVGGAFGISTGAVAGIAGATAALGLLGKQAASAATDMLNLRTRFTAATGSAAEGAREFATVSSLANRLGVDVTALATAYASFTAAARGTSLEGDKARQVFEAISTASARMGLSSEQTSRALLALQQMISKGTVQAEELRGQLGEALPGAFQIAARAMGITTQQLGKLMEQGLLAADVFAVKFAGQLNKEAGPAVERIGVGTTRLSNTLKEVATTVAGPFVSAWDKAAGVMETFLGRMFKTSSGLEQIQREMAKTTGAALDDIKRLDEAGRKAVQDAQRRGLGVRADAMTPAQVAGREVTRAKISADIAASEEELFGPGRLQTFNPIQAQTDLENANKKTTESFKTYSGSLKRTMDETQRLNAELGVLRQQQGAVLEGLQQLAPANEANRAILETQLKTWGEEIATREKRLKTLRDEDAAAEKAIRTREQAAEAAERLAEQERRKDLELRERLTAVHLGLTEGEDAQQRFTEGRKRMTQAQQDAANATLQSAEALHKDNAQLQAWSQTMQRAIELTKASGLADVAGGRGIGAAPYPFQQGGAPGTGPLVEGAPPSLVGQPLNMAPWRVQERDVEATNVEARAQAIKALQADIQRQILSPQDFEKWTIAMSDADSAYKALATSAVDFTYALQAQQDEAKRTRDAMGELADSLTGNLFNAIRELTETGKLSFKDLANSVISDLTRILQQQFLMPKIASWGQKALEWGLGLLGAGGAATGLGGAANLGTALGGTGGLQFGQTGGPLRRGLTLVGEAGPEAVLSRGGRAMVFPASHPLTRMAVRAHLPGRQFGGPLPSMMGGEENGHAAEQPAMPGTAPAGTRGVNIVFNITTPDATSFIRSRGEIQRAMGQAVRQSQYAP